MSCSGKTKSKKTVDEPKNLIAVLDTIWRTEQIPIQLRDSLMQIYGTESKEAAIYQKEFRKNHALNIIKVKEILAQESWPEPEQIGEQGNITICNVLQHTDLETRESYIPLMKQAVLDNKLEARFLVRAEDRNATEKGELQIYGGQMKFYPETKSFNVWPVYDPANIDKRRAEIGLNPIAEFLKDRFDFEWSLEEQLKRSEEFEKQKQQEIKPKEILFVCTHGAARSPIAAAYFNKIASEQNLNYRAIFRGTEPDAELTKETIKGLGKDELPIKDWKPELVTEHDMSTAHKIVTFDCVLPSDIDLKDVEQWNGTPSISADYNKARNVIREKVEDFIKTLPKD